MIDQTDQFQTVILSLWKSRLDVLRRTMSKFKDESDIVLEAKLSFLFESEQLEFNC